MTPHPNAKSTVLPCAIKKLLAQRDNFDSIPKSHCHTSLTKSSYGSRSDHKKLVFGVLIHLIIVVGKQGSSTELPGQ